MNSIHFVIKRLANIRKYLKQKGFLGKIAPMNSSMFIFIQSIFLMYTRLLQSWYYKKKGKPFVCSSLLSNFAQNLKKQHYNKVL